jgi:uncharacterized protein (TIGR02217 family)
MFVESRFPSAIAFGATGGPRFLTRLTTAPSGYEARTQAWTADLMGYDVGMNAKGEADTRDLIAFWLTIAKGRANGFRFKDHSDYIALDQFIGTGDGETRTFQLRKLYTSDVLTYERIITKPVAGTVSCKVNGVAVSSSMLIVDTVRGLVAFLDPPADDAVITASFQFDVPVRFNTDWLSIRKVDLHVWAWDSIPLLEIRVQDMTTDDPEIAEEDDELRIALTEHWEYELPDDALPLQAMETWAT